MQCTTSPCQGEQTPVSFNLYRSCVTLDGHLQGGSAYSYTSCQFVCQCKSPVFASLGRYAFDEFDTAPRLMARRCSLRSTVEQFSVLFGRSLAVNSTITEGILDGIAVSWMYSSTSPFLASQWLSPLQPRQCASGAPFNICHLQF